MSTLAATLNDRRWQRWGIGRIVVSFGLRFTAIVSAVLLVAVVILIGLFLANIDTLFAGILGVEDAILIPVQDTGALNN